MARYRIDPTAEELLDRSEVAKTFTKLQRRKKPMHENGVTRWFRVGVRGIPLPSVLIGGKRFSSLEAIRWWIVATTAADAVERGAASDDGAAPLTAEERRTLEAAGLQPE